MPIRLFQVKKAKVQQLTGTSIPTAVFKMPGVTKIVHTQGARAA